MSENFEFYASCPPGAEALLAAELNALGLVATAAQAGASFKGPLEAGYRACLWSRIASRVLLNLARFSAATPEKLYAGVQALDWSAHLSAQHSFKVSTVLAHSALTHSLFATQKIKDAIVDQFRERSGERPSVDRVRPDLRVHVYVFRDVASLSLDLSGESLHRRGYRGPTTAAPLKENLAAAVLQYAGWPTIAAGGGAFIDPLCGAGALPIEAALMALDVAPGLLRAAFGFERWLGHDAALWERLRAEADARRAARADMQLSIQGSDLDPHAVDAARLNAEAAGVAAYTHFECRSLDETARVLRLASGLLACNPPYGERIGAEAGVGALYAQIGRALRQEFAALDAVVLTDEQQWQHRMRLTPQRVLNLQNGPMTLRVLSFAAHGAAPELELEAQSPKPAPPAAIGGGKAIRDRLLKNRKRLQSWRRQQQVHCYRLYDADIPEYGLAVDVYESAETYALIQEYAPPASVNPDKAAQRLHEAIVAVGEVLVIPLARVVVKQRRRQGMLGQYAPPEASGEFLHVEEGGLKFFVNLSDYLDSGLYLDHRDTRRLLREEARGRRFLNLFGYTATASVYAAAGGAVETVTLDLSNTYLDWAERNLALNGYTGSAHQLVRADCLGWLRDPKRTEEPPYGLIFADVPTYSNSKSTREDFDVQRDHVALIRAAMRLLEPEGALLFSVHFRRFKLDAAALAPFRIEDLSAATLPPDFARDPRVHYCWRVGR